MEPTAGVLIAVTSPLVRLRLRHVLLQDVRIRLLGEATDGAQLAERVQAQMPQVILCDDRMLVDPHLEALFAPRKAAGYKVIVVAANTRTVNKGGAVAVSAVLPIDLPAEEMVHEIFEALREVDAPATPVEAPAPRLSALQHRFVTADDPEPGDGGDPGADLHGGGTHEPSTTPLNRETHRILGSAGRRRQEEGHLRLTAVLQAIKSEQTLLRDAITGLANTRALGNALRALPTVDHPAAIVVVDVWHALETAVEPDLELRYSILRSIGALLRANSRQEDLVCRLDGMTFAIVMPGLDAETATMPLRRLRAALDRQSQPTEERHFPLVVAMGIGFWDSGQPPAQPLERAWQAMVAERDGRGG